MKIKSFTLLELIVVISIILILFSFFFPILSQARQEAQRTHCANNLRQIVGVALVYQINHSTVMPASFGDTSVGKVNHWINYMISGGLGYKVFQCPVMTDDMMFDPAGHDPDVGNIYTKSSYIMNIIKPNSWSGATISSPKSISSGWGISSTVPVKPQQIKNPSSTIYFTDVMGGISNSHSGINDFRRTDWGITPTVTVNGFVRWVGNHHNGGFNAAFGDGRVKWLQQSTQDQWVAVPNHP